MSNHSVLPKVVVLLGPTAAGKTKWSLELAKMFDGEVVSADSRQIYKKMDIGTAKEIGEWRRERFKKKYLVEGVPHYLVDFLDPGKSFSAAEFRDQAVKHVKEIHQREKTSIVAGGTGLYIQALVENLRIPHIAPNKKLRRSLELKSHDELMHLLNMLDPKAAQQVDAKNKRRIIRALEVCILSGEPFSKLREKGEAMFQFLQIGIDVPRELLYSRIDERVETMVSQGLLEELQRLLKQKYSWELPSMSGIGYRQFKDHIEGKISLDEAKERLKRDTRHFARRQLTWFRRDPSIQWVKTYEEAEQKVHEFLKQ